MNVNTPLPLAGPVLAAARRQRESTILWALAVLRVSTDPRVSTAPRVPAAPHETIRRP